VSVAIVGILASMAVPSYGVIRRRFYDSTALSDVLNVGKAVEGIDPRSARTFSEVVTGPGSIRNLPGPRVSRGTTLTITYRITRGVPNYTVRGVHRSGQATFFFQNGRLFATGARL
jgi:type II secretory pathway pseudopilin PulG